MIFRLKDRCMKVDRPNAIAMINGFRKGEQLHHQSIWLAVKDFQFPALLTMQRSNTPYKVNELGKQLNLKEFTLPLKYITTLAAEYFIKNEISLWEALCSNGLFDIWKPDQPYRRFAQSKSSPTNFRIQLLRIFEIEHAFDISDIKFTTDRIDTLITQSKQVNSIAPIISNFDFAKIQDLLELSTKDFLTRKPVLYSQENFQGTTWSEIEEEADKIEKQINEDQGLSETEKKTIISARRGQGKFREDVIALHGSCPFTGISNPLLLRAGHIKPWAKCETNKERTDPLNGLALSPAADHLFDKGYLAFSDEGKALFSQHINIDEILKLGFSRQPDGYQISILNETQLKYIQFHRNSVFKTK